MRVKLTCFFVEQHINVISIILYHRRMAFFLQFSVKMLELLMWSFNLHWFDKIDNCHRLKCTQQNQAAKLKLRKLVKSDVLSLFVLWMMKKNRQHFQFSNILSKQRSHQQIFLAHFTLMDIFLSIFIFIEIVSNQNQCQLQKSIEIWRMIGLNLKFKKTLDPCRTCSHCVVNILKYIVGKCLNSWNASLWDFINGGNKHLYILFSVKIFEFLKMHTWDTRISHGITVDISQNFTKLRLWNVPSILSA